MALNLFTSNRMEVLAAALCSTLRVPPANPFTKEVIVVQSKGMQRWLSMQLASRFGVWANGYYPFPNAMVHELFEKFFSPAPDFSLSAPEVMTWKIMRLLPDLLKTAPFSALQHYLTNDRDELKLFQLSEKIADTFDQYTLYRSEMLRAWEEAVPESTREGWQAMLWRELSCGSQGMHRGRVKEMFCRQLSPAAKGVGEFPERVALFGISYLPKFHLDIFSSLSTVTEVNLFLLSPSREYWGDIISKKKLAGLPAMERALRSEGNPLLATLGIIGRDFSEMVIDLSDEAFTEEDEYVDPGESTLLHALQSDILNLKGTGEERGRRSLKREDRSVWIHSCHSALREVEVLYDNILFMLEHISGLNPRDIVVMTPDIETYSPYISSVFGAGEEGGPALQYSIADRRMMNEGNIAGAVLKVLSLYGSRLEASELFDLLASPPVSRRFLLSDEELEIVRGWIEKTGIRWGMDESDRRGRELPAYRENSWMAGLDRLLLGYAMPDEGMLFNEILPFDDISGSTAETLGKFADFVHAVKRVAASFEKARCVGEWRVLFEAMLGEFIAPDESSEREYSAIITLGEQIAESATLAEFSGEVSPAVILSWFRSRLEQQEQGMGFMTGGITFCAMLPMRSIPFRVVGLIGMNDSVFPRQSKAPGFDLIAQHPRKGDRSLRNEDRYLFLESIMSARDVLYISYVGQSTRDNSESGPSVLVSELIDGVRRGFSLPDEGSIEEHLVVRHRLQAFNREYFTADSSLFSYSVENYHALVEKERGRSLRPFLSERLKEPPDEWKEVRLEKLLLFYDNPSRFFLEHRLGIRLEAMAVPLEDREPFEVEGVERYLLKQELLEVELEGGNPEELLPLFRSRGVLPPARHGDVLFRKILDEVRAFAGSVVEKTGGERPLPPLEVDLQLGEFRLTGTLEHLWPRQQLHYRCARMKVKDQLRSWIEHLVLNAVAWPGYPVESALVMSNDVKSYRALPDAMTRLERLLGYYWQGLSLPLRFFPRSSWAYAAKGSVEAARKEWRDDTFNNYPGEGSDPSIRRCFGGGGGFDEEFCRIAVEVLSNEV